MGHGVRTMLDQTAVCALLGIATLAGGCRPVGEENVMGRVIIDTYEVVIYSCGTGRVYSVKVGEGERAVIADRVSMEELTLRLPEEAGIVAGIVAGIEADCTARRTNRHIRD